jgi:N-acetylated-alpha-linked acidic dipeptidase
MRIMRAAGLCVVVAGCVWFAASRPHAQTRAIPGYSAPAAQLELDWEKKIQAIPKPENIKANMMELAAEPHHLGSERQHQNALWLQRTLRGYGLDAQIEQFDVLFSTPVERKLEIPGGFVAQLKETPVPGDPTSGQSTQLPGISRT